MTTSLHTSRKYFVYIGQHSPTTGDRVSGFRITILTAWGRDVAAETALAAANENDDAALWTYKVEKIRSAS